MEACHRYVCVFASHVMTVFLITLYANLGGGTVTPFLFMHLETADKRYTGLIVSSYGADGER